VHFEHFCFFPKFSFHTGTKMSIFCPDCLGGTTQWSPHLPEEQAIGVRIPPGFQEIESHGNAAANFNYLLIY
jgi:hypothetical protein